MSGMKLFLSVLHTVLKCMLDYLSAAAIILKSDIFQLIQSSWSFPTFQIIGIKYYKLSILPLLLFLQSTESSLFSVPSHVLRYLLLYSWLEWLTGNLNRVSGLFPCLWIMRTFSTVKKMFVFCISSVTVPTRTIGEIHLTHTKPMSSGFQIDS